MAQPHPRHADLQFLKKILKLALAIPDRPATLPLEKESEWKDSARPATTALFAHIGIEGNAREQMDALRVEWLRDQDYGERNRVSRSVEQPLNPSVMEHPLIGALTRYEHNRWKHALVHQLTLITDRLESYITSPRNRHVRIDPAELDVLIIGNMKAIVHGSGGFSRTLGKEDLTDAAWALLVSAALGGGVLAPPQSQGLMHSGRPKSSNKKWGVDDDDGDDESAAESRERQEVREMLQHSQRSKESFGKGVRRLNDTLKTALGLGCAPFKAAHAHGYVSAFRRLERREAAFE